MRNEISSDHFHNSKQLCQLVFERVRFFCRFSIQNIWYSCGFDCIVDGASFVLGGALLIRGPYLELFFMLSILIRHARSVICTLGL